jgi:hypothetical protein
MASPVWFSGEPKGLVIVLPGRTKGDWTFVSTSSLCLICVEAPSARRIFEKHGWIVIVTCGVRSRMNSVHILP